MVKRLYDAVAAAGIFVVEGDIPSSEPARYYPSHRCIVLKSGLRQRDAVSALGHELGHHHYGHRCALDDLLHAKQERQADEFAAQLLITPAEYREAERLHGTHEGAIAHHLGVTVRIVRVWKELWMRRN
ncbi:hypothetical protein AK37_01682 [Rhodococcus pyridinivorans AK37]|uniref:IrrE N-terminal-like domain-containing protein n=1 Tax=Rhodococcus pyridinivorans AK37 TaxID=1114960 RepID=H0JL83_9NOCA|nr:hypothetical protein AK37_01682 [Rhodococcus pyridinivorans AK37]